MGDDLRQWFNRLGAWLRPRRWRREFEEELNAHLALLAEEHRRWGLAPEAADRLARVELGGREQLLEAHRELRGFRWAEDFLRDLRQGFRQLRRHRGFAAIALLTLALGVGVNTVIFSLLQRELGQPLPYPHSESLLTIAQTDSSRANPIDELVNAGVFQLWQKQAPAFENMSLLEARGYILTGQGPARVLHAARVSSDFLATLGAQPLLGRSFTAAEEIRGQDHEVLLTWPLWQQLFHGSPRAIGRQLTLNGKLYAVIGILPRGFYLPRLGRLMGPFSSAHSTPPIELFKPLGLQKWERKVCACIMNFIALGRLRPGVSLFQASEQLDLVQQRIAAGLHISARRHLGILLTTLQRALIDSYRPGLYLLAAGAGLLLLLIAVNLANLLLARNSGRLHEMAVRSSLGAGRGRLLCQLLSEMLWLITGGGFLGIVLSWAGIRLLADDAAAIGLPRLAGMRPNVPDLAFALAAALAVGAVFVLPPTLRLLRQAAPETLQVSQSTIASHRQSLRLREWLSGAEIALSALLLAGAMLLAVSLAQVLRANRIMLTRHALTLDLAAPLNHDRTGVERLRFYRTVLRRVRRLGDVRAAGLISQLPLEGQTWTSVVRFLGQPAKPRHEGNFRFISPGYFRAAGIPLLSGGTLTPHRGDVAIISENVVRQVLGGRNPIGMQVRESGSKQRWLRVVGVAADVRASPEKPAPLMIYEPYQDWPWYDYTLVLRTAGNWRAVASSLPALIRRVDPATPLRPARSLAAIVNSATHTRRFQTLLATGYALAAALLAALGLYGVLAATVALRRHEIAIRMALGADAAQVRRLVLLQIVRMLGAGLAAGLVLSVLLARLLASLLYGVSPFNPWVYLGVALGLALMALLAGYWPARQASRLDPARILHAE